MSYRRFFDIFKQVKSCCTISYVITEHRQEMRCIKPNLRKIYENLTTASFVLSVYKREEDAFRKGRNCSMQMGMVVWIFLCTM